MRLRIEIYWAVVIFVIIKTGQLKTVKEYIHSRELRTRTGRKRALPSQPVRQVLYSSARFERNN